MRFDHDGIRRQFEEMMGTPDLKEFVESAARLAANDPEPDTSMCEWEGDVCVGEMYSGSFDFTLQWHLTDPDPNPEVDTFTGNLVILQGYDGFEGLHGVLEQWGRTGPTVVGGRVAWHEEDPEW